MARLEDLTSREAIAGLKTALEKGSQSAIASLGRADGFLGGTQRPGQGRGPLALLDAEVCVAGAHGQSAVLADRRANAYLHWDVEIAHQTADHERLLRVLLPEVGAVGLRHVEELRHHGGDPAEVFAAAVGGVALKGLGEATDLHGRVESVGVDLLDGRDKEQVHARRLRLLRVA